MLEQLNINDERAKTGFLKIAIIVACHPILSRQQPFGFRIGFMSQRGSSMFLRILAR
jgi:hypothetical protein